MRVATVQYIPKAHRSCIINLAVLSANAVCAGVRWQISTWNGGKAPFKRGWRRRSFVSGIGRRIRLEKGA
jgi:hypothetical protein